MRDPEVSYWLGGALSQAELEGAFQRARLTIRDTGMGMWAAERRSDGAVVGSVGARRISFQDHPLQGEIELGWRLSRDQWGFGYASEGAAAVLAWAWGNLRDDRVVAFTASTNGRSEAVMRRIGMARAPEHDFDHPTLAPGHPLRRHIVYMAQRP